MVFPRVPRLSIGGLAALVVLMVGCSGDRFTDPQQDTPLPLLSQSGDATELDQHLILLGAPGSPSDALLTALQAAGGTVLQRHDEIGVLTASGLTDAAASDLASMGEVAGVNRDRMEQWLPEAGTMTTHESGGSEPHVDPRNATFFNAFQWDLRQIQAPAAWDVTPQGAGALVCVLDTGIDPGHIDLVGRVDLSKSASFIAEPNFGAPLLGQVDIFDYNWHGSFVASRVASNSVGMASVAPHATICAVKVLNVFGSGPFSGVIAGIIHSVNVGADVINMSLGAYFNPESFATGDALVDALHAAVLFAAENGVLVVASSGNGGIDLGNDPRGFLHLPSQLSGVMSVGATGPINQANFDLLTNYSNFGTQGGVNVVAGGGRSTSFVDGVIGVCSRFSLIFPICATGNFYLVGATGTSFSAPLVAGVAAVIESTVPGDQNRRRLTACIYKGADIIDGLFKSPLYGRGRVDVFDSVRKSGCGKRQTHVD